MINIDVYNQNILLLSIKIQNHICYRINFFTGIGERLEINVFTGVQKMCPGRVLQPDVKLQQVRTPISSRPTESSQYQLAYALILTLV